MGQLFDIGQAWYKVLTRQTTEIHRERADTCNFCENAIYKKYLDFIDDDLKEVKGFVCDLCNCPLQAKIRSKDVCYKWKR